MAKIKVKSERCKGCGLCAPQCPIGNIIMSRETNANGHQYPVIDQKKCTGCTLCCKICPDLAIEIE